MKSGNDEPDNKPIANVAETQGNSSSADGVNGGTNVAGNTDSVKPGDSTGDNAGDNSSVEGNIDKNDASGTEDGGDQSNDKNDAAGSTDGENKSDNKNDTTGTNDSGDKSDDKNDTTGTTDGGDKSDDKDDTTGSTDGGDKSDDKNDTTGTTDGGDKSDDKNNTTGTTDGGNKNDTGKKDNDKKNPVIVSTLNTGNLTEKGDGYEGVAGTGKYNYGEALQKSLLFYELQRSGDLPEKVRCNWRGDSSLNDGKDAGLDLTGGWYDAGDNVKFNLPMAYTAAMLGWSIYEDKAAYKQSGQLEYALGNIKWANDYFIKCHPEDEVYYYQIGDGNQDHTYWGAAETVEYRMNRPSYKVTKSSPGSAVCGETAASLAVCSLVYKDIDSSYSALCLKHAKSLYKFARDTKSDAGYTAANGFYNSWSGFYDELAWSGAWLYLATGDKTYLTNAESDFKQAGHDSKWAMCWDDVHIGAAVMLAKITGDKTYTSEVETHLDWWSKVSSDHITYSPKGLAWLDTWGSLRYATTTSFIACVYADWDGCPSAKASKYWSFAESQANYALGSSGRSFVVGFGENAPKCPHHRTAQGSYCDNMNEPSTFRHTLYGALVGGPDASDGYTDTVTDFNKNEVACDYNAGFTGLLAKMYGKYHGKTLKNFGAVETIDTNEFYVSGGINVDGSDFIEIKANICNVSAWPARVAKKLEFRYFLDLSEVYKAGGSASDIVVTTNYMQAGKSAGLKVWDEDKHIYYLSVDFSGDLIYPGGQDKYKKEIQVRIRNTKGTWDNSNDPSFYNMTSGGNSLLTKTALYENGKLVFGTEAPKGKNAGTSVIVTGGSDNGGSTGGKGDNGGNTGSDNGGNTPVDTGKGTATNESLSVKVDYANMTASTSSMQGTMEITNNSNGSLQLKDLSILFYFTNEDKKALTFDCYHASINTKSGAYTGLNGVSGAFSDQKGKDTDTVCKMTFSDSVLVGAGDKITVNFCIHHTDWSNMNTTNDFSVSSVENIVIQNGKKKIFGNEP